MKATLSFVVAQITILSLPIFARHDLGRSPIRLLRNTYIMVAAGLFALVAPRPCVCCAFDVEAGVTFFAYIFFACNTQYATQHMRTYNKARFGSESRVISRIGSVVIYVTMAIFVVALCTYITQRYSGIDQQYALEKILPWGIFINSWYHPIVMVVTKYCNGNKKPMIDTEKPYSDRILSISNLIAVFIACEVHGVVLQYYPPTNWKDMIAIPVVGFAIGAVYYQVASPDILLLHEPIHEHHTIEKLPLTNAEDH
ncbi:hypothetical protein BC943DRAFT_328422 [Umbelopsis sp. AD052]|nr:hypothetical protein BC943DRAFT_328422 [Umbelopsis sp. AD052]